VGRHWSRLPGTLTSRAVPEIIDLGGTAQRFCVEKSASAPRRAHMISFNHTHSHAIVSSVTSGHVLFMIAATRTPVVCFDVGEEAHAAFPSPDQSHVVVANQNGKLLQRIRTDYATNSFSLEPAATLDLARCRTPSGAACADPPWQGLVVTDPIAEAPYGERGRGKRSRSAAYLFATTSRRTYSTGAAM
jgi:hypothetical protein